MNMGNSVAQKTGMKGSAFIVEPASRTRWFISATKFDFWYLGILRLCVGLAQIVSVVWCIVAFLRDGITPHTMHVAFVGVGITTLSLLLFKILHRAK